MRCSACGRVVRAGAGFCGHCGATLSGLGPEAHGQPDDTPHAGSPTAAVWTCSHCGEDSDITAEFCLACGTVKDVSATSAGAAAPPRPAGVKGWTCPTCSRTNELAAGFCGYCGAAAPQSPSGPTPVTGSALLPGVEPTPRPAQAGGSISQGSQAARAVPGPPVASQTDPAPGAPGAPTPPAPSAPTLAAPPAGRRTGRRAIVVAIAIAVAACVGTVAYYVLQDRGVGPDGSSASPSAQGTGSSPAGLTSYRVTPDGSADESLRQAVLTAADGATIELAPGEYTISGGLTVDRSLTLKGAGSTQTTILLSDTGSGGALTVSQGVAEFSAADITFKLAGDPLSTTDSAVRVLASRAELRACRFVNAGESGLRIAGSSQTELDGCTASGNRQAGFAVGDQAKLTARDVVSSGNLVAAQANGVTIMDDATATLSGITCSDNWNGVYVTDSAQCTIDGATCNGNACEGIACDRDSVSHVKAASCAENETHGIVVYDHAHAEITDAVCTRNNVVGIMVTGHAHVEILSSRCERNSTTYHNRGGICVARFAVATVKDNTCTSNGGYGILFMDNASGSVNGNTCSGSQKWGILVNDNADPVIGANHARVEVYRGP